MKPAFPFCFLVVLLLAALSPAADITAEKDGSVLRFSTGGKAICDYQMEPGNVPEGVNEIFKHGAHLHPVYSPGGKLVTGNHQPDHPWQRGIWLAWTKTEFGDSHPDFWNMGKTDAKGGGSLPAEVRFVKLDKSWGGADGGGFISEHVFLDHSHAPDQKVLNETWEVHVSQKTLDGTLANIIDLTSTQTCAGDKPLKLPKYHYGGLGVRGNALWNPVDAVTMLTSEGRDRKNGDSTKAKWVYLGGDVDGASTGIAILIHPSDFRFPQPLRLNPKNPQLCVAPSQDGDWAIESGKPYISKYRILVFDGKPDAKWIEAQWAAYSTTK
ncbi:MAG: PmoA family protein [Verrucomicrobiaceae bacterium]